jgi:hypothetical protein
VGVEKLLEGGLQGRGTKRAAALVAITNAESTPHKKRQEVVELKREEHASEAIGEGFTPQANTKVVQYADMVQAIAIAVDPGARKAVVADQRISVFFQHRLYLVH